MCRNSIGYSEAVKIAEKSVKDINDPKIKLVAFETILKDILSKETNSKNKFENHEKIIIKDKKEIEREEHQDSLKLKFSKEIGIEISNVDYIYNINEEKESYFIVCDFQHSTGKWSQINYVLLSLFANYVLYSKRASLSLPIIRNMKDFGFGALPNINAFMRSMSPQFVHVRTKKKKSENTFELTDIGIKAVKTLCNEIVKNEGIVPLEPIYLPKKVLKTRGKSNLVIQIINLITEGFFNEPKTIQELKQKLVEKGQFYERNIIDEKIRRRFLRRELKRLKINKKWHYVIK